MSTNLKERRKALVNKMVDNSVLIVHSGYQVFRSNDATYDFFVNNNFYYLTNIDQANVILMIGKSNEEYFEKLFIEKIDEEKARWLGATKTFEEASILSQMELKNIIDINFYENYLNSLFQPGRYGLHDAKEIYLDLEYHHLPLYNTFAKNEALKLRDRFPFIKINNCYDMIINLRMCKDESEVSLIKESISTTKNAIYEVMKHHQELKNESLAMAYHDFILIKEGKPKSFNDIIACHHNATVLHYDQNSSDIPEDALLLMDVGCYTNHYSSDITRTIPVSGTFTPRQKEVYEVVLDVNKKCIAFAKPGLSWKQLNDYANNLLVEGLIKLGKISDASELRKYYFHSIGHSLGLDVHDPSPASKGIETGMVITIEPGLYIPEENIGIRIEDDILITNDGAIVLSNDIIKEVEDIEKFMKHNKNN